jgi:O-acetyl-ADP-ribose deacetylase (regulator of RNase III)
MPIKYIHGDATAPAGRPAIIVHVCNDVGAWGAGFVLAISQRWMQPERLYRSWARGGEAQPFELGEVQFVVVESGLVVANLVGQHGLRRRGSEPPVRLHAIARGLSTVADRVLATGASVHMPCIGCGLAGGTWREIGPVVERELVERGVDVTVYDLALRS